MTSRWFRGYEIIRQLRDPSRPVSAFFVLTAPVEVSFDMMTMFIVAATGQPVRVRACGSLQVRCTDPGLLIAQFAGLPFDRVNDGILRSVSRSVERMLARLLTRRMVMASSPYAVTDPSMLPGIVEELVAYEPIPEKDGWDVTLQAHLTLDHRHNRHGVTWGSYLQLTLEPSVPLLDSYGYQNSLLRAYHSWCLFEEHEFELRGQLGAGRHMPAHEELTIGGTADLRGYDVDQFRGDLRAAFRAEYSIPLFKWRFLSFRAIGFYDAGYVAFHSRRPNDRDYLPNQLTTDCGRTNVGTGLRIYLDNIVLPLLGFDLAYGIEGHSPRSTLRSA